MTRIAPSILAADFARLGEQVAAVERDGAEMLHIDVMDGRFVPNISIGVPVVESLRAATDLTLDCHLMIVEPGRYVEAFAKAGARMISVHQEACPHLDRDIRRIRDLGAQAGVALNPATPLHVLDEVLPLVDFVLIMSVNPGFGGQKLIPAAVEKVGALAGVRAERRLDFRIEVDGGVDLSNAAAIAAAGCDILVSGSGIFGAADPAEAVRSMIRLTNPPGAARA